MVEYAEDIKPDQLLLRCELRQQIAAGACRLAAKNMTGWQIDQLRELAEELEAKREASDRKARYHANFAFHNFLLENCGNPLFRSVWDAHHLMPPRPRSQAFEGELQAELGSVDQISLLQVVDAIAMHDQNKAEQRMSEKVAHVTEAL